MWPQGQHSRPYCPARTLRLLRSVSVQHLLPTRSPSPDPATLTRAQQEFEHPDSVVSRSGGRWCGWAGSCAPRTQPVENQSAAEATSQSGSGPVTMTSQTSVDASGPVHDTEVSRPVTCSHPAPRSRRSDRRCGQRCHGEHSRGLTPSQGDKVFGLIISAIVVGSSSGPWVGWCCPAARTCRSGSRS
jgi:hypothetical protein